MEWGDPVPSAASPEQQGAGGTPGGARGPISVPNVQQGDEAVVGSSATCCFRILACLSAVLFTELELLRQRAGEMV